MGNVRSLDNKMDELTALVRKENIFRECSLMCFTETWLHDGIPDSSVSIDGFSTVRGDRRREESGKRKGGGLSVYINNRWCHPGHVTVKERVCSPDIELLAVGLRPYYLPREFSHTILISVYIPPSANAAGACDVIHSVTARLQTRHPDAFFMISGDFNHATLTKTLPTFTQYVDCHTRGERTLDLMYANVKEAYRSTALPPLGRSDHNLVHLLPLYTPLVQRQPATTKTVKRWSEGANAALQGCFEATDWEALCEPHGADIDGLTDCITDYINFCVDTHVPTQTIYCFPNNKPWVTKDIKVTLNEKKKAFRSGDREAVKGVQRLLSAKIREGKEAYRRKLEQSLQRNNTRDVWRGMRSITGYKSSSQVTEGSVDRANEFNTFFNRFNDEPQIHPPSSFTTGLQVPPQLNPDTFSDSNSVTITADQVRRELNRLCPTKAAGPDGISPRVLKACAPQLCGVFQHIFNLSLHLERVPVGWKTSCLVPVPKVARPSVSNDYRPVALTSHIMKAFERLILESLRPLVKPSLDPLQFAYQPQLGVDDAIIHLLHRTYTHLDKPGGTVRITFFDFSSAFNTIRPALLGEKLKLMQVNTPLVSWILDYLTGRPQYVRLQNCVSDTVICSTGAPQGTVLSPFLFTLYTSDFRYNSESCHLQKFSDDSAVVGCIQGGDITEYRSVVDSFVDWCELNHLQLNINKTKELVVDFRKSKTPVTPLAIRGEDVEVVSNYKYLGVHLDNKLDWTVNSTAIYKKGQSRLYFLRRLRSFNVCSTMLRMFYESVVASAIFYAVVCWGSNMKVADTNRLDKLIRRAGSILGEELDPLHAVAERRMLSKLLSILDNPSHPLHSVLAGQRSTFSQRLITAKCSTERHRRSFLPVAIKLYNSSPFCKGEGD